MLTHQATYIDHLLDVVEAEQVDVVLLAGDVYDRALPPVDAVALADETFSRLAHSRARTIVTSGNHDSAQRLGFASRLIDSAGIYVRADANVVGQPVLLADNEGEVAFYPLPYLDPEAVREPWGLPVRSHEVTMGEAMKRVRGDLDRRGAIRSVVIAHAFVAGAQPSDSERDISVGGVSLVPTTVFEGIDYVALGHLHGRHRLNDHIRYSGSPLAYSFSEANHLKGSWLVDLGRSGLSHAEFIAAPVPRPLARLRGTLESVLSEPALAVHEDSWVQVTLTDDVRPAQAMERLRRRFAHTLVLGFDPSTSVTNQQPASSTRQSDHDISLDFVAAVRGTPASADEALLLQAACDACAEDRELDFSTPTGRA
jgi:DNA repair protein SbcD/Mre11